MKKNQPSDLTGLLGEWSRRPGDWSRAAIQYKYLSNLRSGLDGVLEALAPEVDDLLDQVKTEERRNLELQIATANKIAPQNVTEEMFLSYSELLSQEDAALRRVAKANSKRYGRPLLQKLHPDHGGDPDLFIIARQAVNAGDTELLRIFLYNLTGKGDNPDEVVRLIKGRIIRLEGSVLFRVSCLYASSRKDTALAMLKSLLSNRLMFLRKLNTPGAFNET